MYGTYIDQASENGPSGHKIHVIIKNLISWALYNIIKFCKLYNVAY